MGRDLVAASEAARRTFEEADDVLGFGLSRLCFDGPDVLLTETANAQPAILVHSVAVLRTLDGRLGEVACAAGHSLGEFTAYVAAGALPFADAVRTVRRRGELMQRSGAERPGGMAAILGLDEHAVEAVCAQASAAGGECVAANYNAPGQLVISGDVPSIERALVLAKAAGAKRAIRLNVSGAFHSPLMLVAEAGLAAQLDSVALDRPAFPIVSNVTAQPVTDPVEVRRLLVSQLTAPVRWADSMRTMLAMGVTAFLELGPGNVLSGLLRRIERSAGARAVGTATEVAAFAA
jgi:[acyl-carrier-protein] S-malonyltransferase